MKKIINNHYFLIVIIVLAALFRIIGQYPGFPDNHPDEIISYGSAINMLYNYLKPSYFYYPAGVPFINVVVYSLFLPLILFRLFILQPDLILNLFQHGLDFFTIHIDKIFGQRYIYAMYWSRYITGFFSVLTVILVYYLSSKIFNKRVGLFSAFFLAVNYRHVIGAYISLPDTYNGFFSLISLLTCFILLKKNTSIRYFLVGISLGLTLSMKYQIFSYAPFLLVHIFWAIKQKKFSYLFYWPFFVSLFLSFLTFLAINPYLIFNLKDFFYHADLTYRWYQMGKVFFRAYPFFYLYHWGIGELLSLAILGGIILMSLKHIKQFIFLFSYVFLFFFIITYYSNGGLYPRNFVTVIPFIIIFAGYFFDQIYRLLKRFFNFRISAIIILTFIVLVSLSHLKNSAIFSYYYSKPWNSDSLISWMEKKIPSSVSIRTYPLILAWKNRDPYLSLIRGKNIKDLPWDYSKGPNSLAEFQEDETDFAILNTQPLQSVTYWWRTRFSPEWVFSHSSVPFDYISNGFYGLTIAELGQYAVHEIYRPWQSPSENNYLIFKIPAKQKEPEEIIKAFNFDNKSQIWQLRGLFNLKPNKFNWVFDDMNKRGGVLIIYGGGQSNTSRLGSPPIEVKSDRVYTVRGWMKNIRKNKDKIFTERDGFLRIDFYKDAKDLDAKGISVAVSSRPYIDKEWVQVSVSAKAPKDAKFMTLSFQREVQSLAIATYLDEVEVYESKSIPEEKFKEVPYIKPTISDKNIYYNSFF